MLDEPNKKPRPLLWTEEDKSFLSENWGKMTIKELSEKLNRSVEGILTKARRLGLAGEQAFRSESVHVNAWTESHVETLRTLWNTDTTLVDIGRRTGHSPDSVRSKATRLNLPKRIPPGGPVFPNPEESLTWTTEEEALLRVLWMRGSSVKNMARRFRKSSQQVRRKALQLGLPTEMVLQKQATSQKTRDPSYLMPFPHERGKELVSPVSFSLPLEGNHCHWPHGDPKKEDFRFCNARTNRGEVYCDEHIRKAYIVRSGVRISGNQN